MVFHGCQLLTENHPSCSNILQNEFLAGCAVALFMKKILLLIIMLVPMSIQAQEQVSASSENSIKIAKSPDNRVALLELYTSEGCSSCPPADHFVSALKDAGISKEQLIPMAFHVTYWDYIGWKDRFANKQYDQRQRDQAHKQKKASVYTPQFMLSGDDYRSYATFSRDVNRLVMQQAKVTLELSVHALPVKAEKGDNILLTLKSDISASEIKDVRFHLAITESNLSSNVKDGENEGEKLRHDFVVRKLFGPYFQSKPKLQNQIEQTITLLSEWKRQDLNIVAFAENPHTGEVLQAVSLKY